MTKVWRVAKNEYLNIVRTKAFIISIVLLPVFMGGAIVAERLLRDKTDLKDRRFAVVDGTGRLLGSLKDAARRRNEGGIFKDGQQSKPRFLPEAAAADAAALSDGVRSGELFAYVVIDADVIDDGGEIAYHSQSPTYDDLPRWLGQTLNGEIRRIRFQAAGLDQAVVSRLSRPARLGQYGLVEKTAAGEVREARKVDKISTRVVPIAAMFLLFMLVMTAAPHLLNNVLEEKMQRISEILVSSVSPFELFLGKLVGIVFVAWTLSTLYLGGVAILAHRFGFADSISVSVYAWFLFFQLLALFIYGSIFSAFGAAASEIRDAQSMMMPAMLLAMIPMFVWMPVLKAPTSSFSMWISLFPPATPFLMLMRIAIPPGPALWEVALGLLLTVAFTLAVVWAGSRIFRVGILSQGQVPSYRKLMSWVWSR